MRYGRRDVRWLIDFGGVHGSYEPARKACTQYSKNPNEANEIRKKRSLMRKVAQARATARPRQAERRERGGLSREAMLCTGGHNGSPNILRTHVRYHSLFLTSDTTVGTHSSKQPAVAHLVLGSRSAPHSQTIANLPGWGRARPQSSASSHNHSRAVSTSHTPSPYSAAKWQRLVELDVHACDSAASPAG